MDANPARSPVFQLLALGRFSGVVVAGLLLTPLALPQARAQQAGFGQTINSPQQERVLDQESGVGPGTSILDATNPIDLMNRIRRATALENATPPGAAIDAALRDFEAAPQPAPATPGSLILAP